MEAERCHVAEAAGLAPLVRRPRDVCRVLGDFQVVLLCDRHDLVHVANLGAVMDYHDRPGLLGYLLFDALRVDVVRFVLDVREHRHSSEAEYLGAAGDEGDRRGYHFVARPQVEQLYRQVAGGGAARGGERVLRAAVSGELALELLDLWAHGEGLALQYLPDRLQFLFAELRAEEGVGDFQYHAVPGIVTRGVACLLLCHRYPPQNIWTIPAASVPGTPREFPPRCPPTRTTRA